LQDAFRRLCGSSGASVVQRVAFVREVIGDGVPPVLADRIFALCGGAPASSSAPGTALTGQKGLGFRDVLTVLVLITRGTHEEKIKCE
jgi:ubiquitin carboxyl-terminal hydrolase 6/32